MSPKQFYVFEAPLFSFRQVSVSGNAVEGGQNACWISEGGICGLAMFFGMNCAFGAEVLLAPGYEALFGVVHNIGCNNGEDPANTPVCAHHLDTMVPSCY